MFDSIPCLQAPTPLSPPLQSRSSSFAHPFCNSQKQLRWTLPSVVSCTSFRTDSQNAGDLQINIVSARMTSQFGFAWYVEAGGREGGRLTERPRKFRFTKAAKTAWVLNLIHRLILHTAVIPMHNFTKLQNSYNSRQHYSSILSKLPTSRHPSPTSQTPLPTFPRPLPYPPSHPPASERPTSKPSLSQLDYNNQISGLSLMSMQIHSDIFVEKMEEPTRWEMRGEEREGGSEEAIDQFFNEEVLVHREEDREAVCARKEQSRSDTLEYQLDSFPQHETAAAPRRKSIFHNFQKHLITLIKKFITLEDSNSPTPLSPLALALWHCFMATRSFNKKMLHMVFGVFQTPKSPSELPKLSQDFPLFRAIVESHPAELIADAQGELREAVVGQALNLSRQLLQSSCNVNRFHEFYEYFTSFAGELRSGPMTKRMTKTRKHFVVEKLSANTNQ